MSKKTHMNIGGMTCIHCQNTIEKALKNTKGVIKASVSYKRGIADIEYDDSVTNVNKLAKVIENEDYKVISSEGKTSPGITETLGILVIIAALYYLLQTFGLLNHLVPDRLADSEMGYGMLFAIGLITSVHCIAMCGGIGVSQSLPNGKEAKALLPAALYNLGRVCSYTAIGFVLGLIGNFIGGGSGIASLVFLLPLLYLSMGHMLWEWPLPQLFDDNHVAMGLVQLILTGIIMVINQKFFVSGFKSLIHSAPNMDALVALGSSAAITTKGSAALISIMCTEWACMLSERDS